MSYVISCCSTADLSAEHFNGRDIRYICFHYELNGKQYPDDLGQSMPFDKFYAAMAAGAQTKTSQVNVDEFIAYFTPMLESGQDILHVCLSSGISGVYNSACAAREILSPQYPERKILLLDSLGASSGYGLFMDKLADLRDSGMDVESLYTWAEENRLKLHHWFFSTDLTFYVRGGRISKASGWFGTVLKICPLLNMDNLGRLIPRYKIRTKAKVIEAIVQKMEEHAQNGRDAKRTQRRWRKKSKPDSPNSTGKCLSTASEPPLDPIQVRVPWRCFSGETSERLDVPAKHDTIAAGSIASRAFSGEEEFCGPY